MTHSAISSLGIAILTLGMVACGSPQEAGDPGAAEAEIAALVQASEDALNDRDFDAFFSPYSESSDLIVYDSPHARGVETAQRLMEQGWATVPSDVTADLRLRAVRLITPNVAIADVDGVFMGSDPAHDRATFVLSRGDTGWQVEAGRVIQPEVGIAAMRDGIASTWAAFETAWQAGDLETVVSFYTADAENMPSFGEVQSGRAEIEASFTPLFDNGAFQITSRETIEVGGQGTAAYEIGVLEQTYTPTGGIPSPQRMRYLSVFHLEPDGVWRFHRWIAQPEP